MPLPLACRALSDDASDDDDDDDDDNDEDDDDDEAGDATGVSLDLEAFRNVLQDVLGIASLDPATATPGDAPTGSAPAKARPADPASRPSATPIPAVAAEATTAPPPPSRMEAYYAAMDSQLGGTAVYAGFDVAPADDADGDADGSAPPAINLDMNLVRNLLQSFAAQEAMDGPATTLLSSLRLPLPRGDLESIPPPAAGAAPTGSAGK